MTATAAALIWTVGICLWALIRRPYRRKAKRKAVSVDRKSTSERIALSLCIIGLAIVPAVHLLTGLFKFADYPFQSVMAFLGTLTMIGFLVLFYLSHKHLDNNWSVSLEIREKHNLVQHGIYRFVRHPMYLSFWLWGLAQFLLIPNWIAGLTGLLSVGWLYFSRVKNEEAMMREVFGDAYDEYSAKTSRLIPGVY